MLQMEAEAGLSASGSLTFPVYVPPAGEVGRWVAREGGEGWQRPRARRMFEPFAPSGLCRRLRMFEPFAIPAGELEGATFNPPGLILPATEREEARRRA
jgi:hypothetical protein